MFSTHKNRVLKILFFKLLFHAAYLPCPENFTLLFVLNKYKQCFSNWIMQKIYFVIYFWKLNEKHFINIVFHKVPTYCTIFKLSILACYGGSNMKKLENHVVIPMWLMTLFMCAKKNISSHPNIRWSWKLIIWNSLIFYTVDLLWSVIG